MQKVLIISYFSPPCNLTSANRIGSWISYFPDNELYPILVTRQWTGKELTERERLLSSGKSTDITKTGSGEIHALPYRSSLRDKLFVKGSSNVFFALLSKILTLFTLIFQNFFVSWIPYNNVYLHAKNLLKSDISINTLIISGNPFEQFFFGFLLKKKFPRLIYVADYRDEWTTHYLYQSLKNKPGVIKILERYSEKKWLKQADVIQTVCPYFSERLAHLHSRKVDVVPNGFDNDFMDLLEGDESEVINKRFTLVYSGTLYPNQNLSQFLKVLESLDQNKFLFHFIGADLSAYSKEVLSLTKKGILKVDTWKSKQEAMEIMKNANGFLMFPFENMKGWPSSKLYDYLSFQKPIVLFPSDKDIIAEILEDTGLGYIADTETELKQLFLEFGDKTSLILKQAKRDKILNYSRKNSVQIFSETLKNK